MINAKKIKELLAKGFILTAMTSVLVFENHGSNKKGETVAYAAEIDDNTEDKTIDGKVVTVESATLNDMPSAVSANAATLTVSEYKAEALNNLKVVYKTYKKSYYLSKEYKKLKKYYKKGVKAIKAAKTNEKIKKAYDTYVKILNSIKPSVLVKYQTTLKNKLTTAYNKLITKNEYSEHNMSVLDSILTEAMEEIDAQVNKTNAKKEYTKGNKNLGNVETKIEEYRSNFISYVNNNSDLTKEQKNTIIENANKITTVDKLKELAEIWGYDETKNKEEKEYITVEQINAKVEDLCKKYPAYTEDEIRVLVATANMDFVKDEDIYTIFNVDSKEELAQKGELLDSLLEEYNDMTALEWIIANYPEIEDPNYDGIERKIEDRYELYLLFFDYGDIKTAKYASRLRKKAANETGKTTNFADPDDIVPGDKALIELIDYLFDMNFPNTNFKYDNGYGYKINDAKMNGGAGYIIKRILVGTYLRTANSNLDALLPQKNNSEITDEAITNYQLNNPLKKIKEKKIN